jgi:hypothetical protein
VRKDLLALPRMLSQQVHRKFNVPFAVSAPSESDRSSSRVSFFFFHFCFKSGKTAAQIFVMPNQQAEVKHLVNFQLQMWNGICRGR